MTLQSQIDRLHRRIRMMMAPAYVLTTDDKGPLLKGQMQIHGTPEIIDGLGIMQMYGFHMNPKPGTDAVALFLAGDRSNPMIVATNHKDFRPRNFQPGEVGIYTDEGDTITLNRDNKLNIASKDALSMKGDNTATVDSKQTTVKGSEKVTLDTPETKATGKIDASGGFFQNGNPIGGAGAPGPPGPAGPQGPQGIPGPAGVYQVGPGLLLNTATDPDTLDVATPYLPIAGGAITGNLSVAGTAAFAGATTAPTVALADNTTKVATTAFVKGQGYATTAALAAYAPLASPVFTGDPQAPTPATADNDTSIATTAFVKAQGYATTAALGAYLPLIGGTIYQAGAGANFVVKSDATLDAYIRVQGARAWLFGPQAASGFAGRFILYDETAAAYRMIIDTAGGVTFGGNILTTGAVQSSGAGAIFQFTDRDGSSPMWGWYAQSGSALLWQSTAGNRISVDASGTLFAAGSLYLNVNNTYLASRDTGGTAYALIGIGTDNRLKINLAPLANVDAAGNWQFSGNVTASGTLFRATGAAYTSGSDSNTARFSPNRWTFRTTAGDEPNAGILDYRGFDAAALAIVGAGTASGNRNVKVWDNLYVVTQAYKPGGGPWVDSSDIRTKEAVADYTTGLDALLRLRPITYRKNGRGGSERTGATLIGLIADDVLPVMPEMVGSMLARLHPDDADETAILTLDMTALPLAIVNALRELAGRVAALEART